ncbi:hypothetical protein [Pseudoneobacillus sp. C159]
MKDTRWGDERNTSVFFLTEPDTNWDRANSRYFRTLSEKSSSNVNWLLLISIFFMITSIGMISGFLLFKFYSYLLY